ncbi:MAG: rRNA pseudouridine synthase [Kiritimatiellae bacterium]|nr:rRNA pseudouridine synthase [Kiritimatiellia bacterium]
MRLQKALAAAGVGSRRGCEELIRAGRVTVDGEVVREMGVRVRAGQRLAVDGVEVGGAQPRRTFLADKPRGVICTSRDPQGRKTLLEWAREEGLPEGRFFSVGRLDVDSEGLILLTTDGDLAQRWGHPSAGTEKEYRVWGDRSVGAREVEAWRRGVESDGETLKALRVDVEKGSGGRVFRVTLGEGRNRQVRRMCEAVGVRVRRLRRVRIGSIGERALKGRRLVELDSRTC